MSKKGKLQTGGKKPAEPLGEMSHLARIAGWSYELEGCDRKIRELTEEMYIYLPRLESEKVDEVVRLAMNLMQHAKILADLVHKSWPFCGR